MATPLLAVVLLALAAAAGGSVHRLRVTDRDVVWLHGSADVTPAAAAVYRRYLRRHRTHRVVGGWFGVVLAVVHGVAARSGPVVGVGVGVPLSDVLFCGLAGVLVGALSAETYRLSGSGSRPAVASLAPRPALRSGKAVLTARVLAGAALVLGLVGVLVAPAAPLTLVLALGGVALVGLGEAARAAIDNRERPVLSAQAAHVDGRIRAYASGAVAHLELSAAALTLAWVASSAPVLTTALGGAGLVLTVVVLGLAVLAVVELRRARPRPPGSFAVPAAHPAAVGT